jgi:hypothetical protein
MRKKHLRSSKPETSLPTVPDPDELIATGDRVLALAAVRLYRRELCAELEATRMNGAVDEVNGGARTMAKDSTLRILCCSVM